MLIRVLFRCGLLLLATSCGVLGGAGSSAKQNRVFVTSAVFNGNLGGLELADLKCQLAATSGGLSGTWKAWLSVAGVEASTRLTLAYPIKDVHGVEIFADASAMNGLLAIPPHLDEHGNVVSGAVWTDTDSAGHEFTASCNNWLSSSPGFTGVVGVSSAQTHEWTQQGAATCDSLDHLYCFEQ